MSRRVVITSTSAICALGLNSSECWENLVNGVNNIAPFSLFDPKDLTFPYGYQLPDGSEALFKSRVKTYNRRKMTRGSLIALSAAFEVVENSKLDLADFDRSRIGVVIGATGTGYAPETVEIDRNRILKNMASASGAWISNHIGIEGPAFVVSTACSSGIYALKCAHDLIVTGECDLVIAGSSESALSYHDAMGFENLMALSDNNKEWKSANRPFDLNRNGFVMGEGGGLVLLESFDHAKKRNADIIAEVHRPALTSEAYNMIAPKSDGEGMAITMKKALDNSGLKPENINYINAHGTSTPLNDIYEAKAINSVFSNHAQKLVTGSTKSLTGHCLSGTGGLEIVFSALAVKNQKLPPLVNHFDNDPEIELNLDPDSCKSDIDNILCNAFAFGGSNASVVISRVKES